MKSEVAPMGNKWWLLTLFLLAVPVVFLGTLSLLARRPTNLGVKAGRLAPCPNSPNCVSTQAEDAGQRIEPLRFTGSAEDAWRRLKEALATLPRTRIITETEDYIHAESTTLVFRFVDDVEFWLDSANHVIQFRSASRAGRSDLGVNRRRMEAVRKAFTDAHSRQAAG